MSGIAEVLLAKNYQVTGSDLSESEITQNLVSKGARIGYGHSAENIKDADVVVISSAVKESNPEVREARRLQIPIIPRAEMLGELMKMKSGIAIAGTHGKTTTTSIVSSILSYAELDPTIIIGGRLNSLGSNAKLGAGEFLVAEADESDRSFLKLPADIAVVTNIDNDHLDHYKDFADIKNSFLEFINKIPFYGRAVLCADDEHVVSLIPEIKKPYFTYGVSERAELRAKNIIFSDFHSRFSVQHRGVDLGEFYCQLPGQHMVLNSLAALGVALEIGIPLEKIREGMAKFNGVRRRFELKYRDNDLYIVDDYAHHPSEIKATIAGIRDCWDKKVVAVFQPHRFSRTRDCYAEFMHAFDGVDRLLVADIYPAGEAPIEGISGQKLAEDIFAKGNHPSVQYSGSIEDTKALAKAECTNGTIVITMGAGPIYKISDWLVGELS